MKAAIFYGSEDGTTADVAEALAEALSGTVPVYDIADAGLAALSDYDVLILGTSTWGIGELQSDWIAAEESMPNLTGKRVALFGIGDQIGYPDSFVDGMGTLAHAAEKAGAELFGAWAVDESYEHEESTAQKGTYFVGLAIDEDNQSELTEERVAAWAQQLKKELGV